MSKRLCISLISAPQRSQQTTCLLQQRRATLSAFAAPNSTRSSNLRNHDHQRRAFHASPSRNAVSANRMTGKPRVKAQQSLHLQQAAKMKEMTASGAIMDYVGLVQAFVPPTGQNLPSFSLSSWRDRKAVEKNRLKNWFRKWIQSPFFAFWLIRPRVTLGIRKMGTRATDLYQEMYTNFARGNVGPMAEQGRLNPNFRKSLETRIKQRKAGEGLLWRLHGYVGKPKTVCCQFILMPEAAKMPSDQRTGIVQAVVRIRSEQSLLQVKKVRVKDPRSGEFVVVEVVVDRYGQEIAEDKVKEVQEREKKDMVEYFVVERVLRLGVWGEWRAWGTTKEMSVSEMYEAEEERKREAMAGTPKS